MRDNLPRSPFYGMLAFQFAYRLTGKACNPQLIRDMAHAPMINSGASVEVMESFSRNIISLSKQGIRTLTASMADSSSFLSREKANSIAAKYLDNLPLKTGEWIMGKRSQNAPKVGGYAVAFKLFSWCDSFLLKI